jgi:hypothetical protein
MILPRAHRQAVFDLTAQGWTETHTLVDERTRPDGYNVG